MKKVLFYLVLGCLLRPGGLAAQETLPTEVQKMLEEAPPAEDYPGADAVYLLDKREFELRQDGTSVTTVHQIVKIFNQRWQTDLFRSSGLEGSFVPLGPVVRIAYLDQSQKVTLKQARAIRADGSVQEIDAATLIQDRPQDEEVAYMYTDRLRQIDFRPLASVGTILDLEYVIEDLQSVIQGHFWDRCVMQREDPVRLSKYVLTVPHGTSFNTKFHRLDEAASTPQEQDQGSSQSFIWQRTDVPPLLIENLMPPRADVTSWILVSSIPSWDQIAAWYNGMVQDKYDSNEEMRAEVLAAVGDVAAKEEVIKRLFYHAQERVHSPDDVGLRGGAAHSATQVFADGVGDCKDQVTLLITLLRLAGLAAYPALLRSRDLGELTPEVPALEQFDHALVAVPRGDSGYIWLDPTLGVCPYGYLPWKDQDCQALVVRDNQGELVRTPLCDPQDNLVERKAKLRLQRNCTLEGEVAVTFHGDFAMTNRRWFQDPGNPPEKWYEAFLNDVRKICSNAVLRKEDLKPPPDVYDLSQPVEASYRFRAEPYLDTHRSGASMSFLPSVLDRWTAEYVTAEQRTHDLVLKPQVRLSIIEFDLPSDYDVFDLPHSVNLDFPFASFKVTYSYQNSHLTFERRIEITRSFVRAEYYQDVREFFKRIEQEDRYTAVFLREVGL